MSVRKRNEFLEGDESEEELENGYGSDAEEGRGAIANKRRKLDSEEDRSDDDISEDDKPPAKSTKATGTDLRFDFSHFDAEDEEDGHPAEHPEDEDEANLSGIDNDNDPNDTTTNPKLKKPKDLLAYEAATRKLQKSGVIYLSRIPPFMKPQTLRHYLLPHAPKSGLGRIFLTPEDSTSHSKRIKNGGNKKKTFTDGWVEFLSKKEAKLAVEKLNGNIIGGKKGGFYHDDIWNLKYLKGFKWDHLTEQIRAENAERTARMREEVRRVRKENRAFVEDVERGKMVEGMERKRRAKGEREGGGDGEGSSGKQQMKFKQKKAKQKEEREKVAEEFRLSEGVRKKIF
ncbi:Pre-rRNA-processing protein ESF2 [Cercospora beticola]|uniref:18S rRNA factor 2 n=1 Tax=Cercospora beticola TaxID=122368 RepID=A0A2G5H8Y5_CERBT|nr:Pre-rRNA-processing protein ESF2 [Cercospora beticola]PIA88994.1 Pre-rRNA-processing protein ESF2 [Cercospora beticola]WPB03178.1 hypothetical protein RHO25_007815 [Cercospora beticola]